MNSAVSLDYRKILLSTGSCLDEIPFSFHEHIKRVEKIQLSYPKTFVPPIINLSLFNYDSSVETRFLAKLEEERKKETEILKLQKQYQLFLDAKKNELVNCTTYTTPICSNVETNNLTSYLSQISHTQNAIMLCQNQTMGKDILVPSRLDPTDMKSQRKPDKVRKCTIDLKDFESEQDPFENMSLKVINDIEELDKVFLAANQPPQSKPEISKSGYEFSQSQSVPVLSGFSATSNPQMPHSYNLAECASNFDNPQRCVTNCSTNYFSSGQAMNKIENHSFQQHSFTHQQCQTSDIPGAFDVHSNVNNPDFNRFLISSIQNFNTHQNNPFNSFKEDCHIDNNPEVSSSSVQRPIAVSISAHNSVCPNIRHAKSTPDLMHIPGSNEVKLMTSDGAAFETANNHLENISLFGRHTPPLHHVNKKQSSDRQSMASKIPSPSSSLLHRQHQLPDNQEKQLVEKLAGAGHHRLLVEKLLAKFGADETKIRSCLKSIDDFILKGHDPVVTQECFMYLSQVPNQAEKYLKTFEIFYAMGFPTENIHKALEISNLEEELALNILTNCFKN